MIFITGQAEFFEKEFFEKSLADAIGSNIVEKCDVTLWRAIQPAIQPLTSDVLRVLLFIAYFISLSSTPRGGTPHTRRLA